MGNEKRFLSTVYLLEVFYLIGVTIGWVFEIVPYSFFVAFVLASGISFIHFVLGVQLIRKGLFAEQQQFMVIVFGGITARMFVMLMVIIILILFLNLSKKYFIINIFLFYFYYLAWEIAYLLKIANRKKDST